MQLLLKDVKFTEKINEEWIKENCYIAGGACVSNFTRSPIHDVDLYFKTKEARDVFVKEIGDDKYMSKNDELWLALLDYEKSLKNKSIEFGDEKQYKDFKISTIKGYYYGNEECFNIKYGNTYGSIDIPFPLFEKQKWSFENGYDYVIIDRVHFDVDNEIFLGNKSVTIKKNKMIYQFILRFYGEPNEVMNSSFDFQHCKIAYDLATNEYIASQETWECLSKREIKYVNSFYPISSLKRLNKYKERGFKYNNDEFVKIIRDIHKVDVDNKFVIEDQLIGYYEDFDYNVVFEDEPLFTF